MQLLRHLPVGGAAGHQSRDALLLGGQGQMRGHRVRGDALAGGPEFAVGLTRPGLRVEQAEGLAGQPQVLPGRGGATAAAQLPAVQQLGVCLGEVPRAVPVPAQRLPEVVVGGFAVRRPQGPAARPQRQPPGLAGVSGPAVEGRAHLVDR